MRVLSYSGTSGDCIEVDNPTDLYPLIDWHYSQMKIRGASKKDLDKIASVMKYAEAQGLGGEKEAEKVKYI